MKNILNKLMSTFGLGSKTPKMVIPPVDLNIPVENPKLVAAIEKHQRIGSNETAVELFETLKRSVFLAGMITNKPLPTNRDEVLFKKDDKLGIITVLDNNDNKLLGLFTDHQQLQSFTNQANSTLVMPTKEAMEFAMRDYSGVVINPASGAKLRLDNNFISTIIGQM